MDKQEALYFLPQTLVITCDNRFTDECSFIAQHLKKASQLQKEKAAIKKLEKESEQLTDQPDLQAPIQKELEKARTECPNHDKLYWKRNSKSNTTGNTWFLQPSSGTTRSMGSIIQIRFIT
jgi:DNA-directed RNA polymerase subunit M/transcription elongation factor TFIIS